MENQIKNGDKETKNKLLEFDNNRGFMRQLLITDQAKKSLIKPKIEANGTSLNLGLLNNVKKFLEDVKKGEQSDQPEHSADSSSNLADPVINKQELGVEFNLLMYKDDGNSEEESEESEQKLN